MFECVNGSHIISASGGLSRRFDVRQHTKYLPDLVLACPVPLPMETAASTAGRLRATGRTRSRDGAPKAVVDDRCEPNKL